MQLQNDSCRDSTEIDIMEEVLPFTNADVLELGCGSARWTRTIVESFLVNSNINPATKYADLSASNRTRIKARLAGNGKPLSKAATPIRVLFEAPNQINNARKAALSALVDCVINTCCRKR